jgi:serine/threonine-protein kinase PknK
LAVGDWSIAAQVGEGTSGVVFRVSRKRDGAGASPSASSGVRELAERSDKQEGALKVARTPEARALREPSIVARVQRRWGPSLLDTGRLDRDLLDLPRGAPWMVTTWTAGQPLDRRIAQLRARGDDEERATLAAIVAHGVGRGLDELHRGGIRHGDVKPANVLLGEARPAFDRADDRGATLVDLDLATDIGGGVQGGTPRYLSPELREGREAPAPAADLYALGLVLAEILVPGLSTKVTLDASAVADLAKPSEATREIVTWIAALVSTSPGARPSAAWLADQAARFLGLAVDAEEVIHERRARVRRTYLAVCSPRIARGARPASTIEDPARAWLIDAATVAPPTEHGEQRELSPLSSFDTARWIVSLVGPAAAAWTLPATGEGPLAERLLALAEVAPPEAWTGADLLGAAAVEPSAPVRGESGPALWIELARALAAPRPDVAWLARAEEEVAAAATPDALAIELAAALFRRGEVGRAFAALRRAGDNEEALLLRSEIARRQGDVAGAATLARRIADAANVRVREGARALLGRLAWDAGDLDRAAREVVEVGGAGGAEVRALVAYARGEHERGLAALDGSASSASGLGLARIEGTRGMLEHARGRARESLEAFGRAVDLAVRAGAVVEEASYLTGLAAAAVDAGRIAQAIPAATRGALLWERLGRTSLAARAHLSRAAAFALVGASHEADLAAEETRRQALAARDARAAAYARWAIAETRPAGDPRARDEVIAAASELASGTEEDRLRAAARLLVWAPDQATFDLDGMDERAETASATARWEWWGARATMASASPRALTELVALLDVPAPISSRGPALAAGARRARALGDGETARRIEGIRRALATTLRENAPAAFRAALVSVEWLAGIADDDTRSALGAAQVGELEAIVRALSSRDRLKPLLEQVVDTMVLWTGVERGLLLLRAPDGHLVPRAARNLARQALAGEQLQLSTGLARRAMAERETICATDAFAQVGDLHASVHALGLRSVLAVPLVARGDVLGVVYLDDRVRRGAFGPGELAWVRLVASQAALAIADARDQTLLRRAVRRAERANARLAAELGAREAELANVRAELASGSNETRFRYDEIAGRSEPMRVMLKLVDRVTASDVPVLLAGESGTGKELVARAIHGNGPRSARAFVSENCGSVPETLLESTLFGHVRGAFTGASATRAGLFDVADGGTLFLDEIGEMPLSMQTKLLRVLQNGEVRAVGGERSRTVDVRIIGATHRDLDAMVAAGTFREDLFYRLNVVSIRVPPLRERREDIPLLVNRFVGKHSAAGKVKVTRAAMDRLTTFPWPGNVRQLENEVRRALVLADERIDVPDLSEEVARGGPSAARDAGLGLKARVDALEAQLVRDALQKTNGNQTRAAEVLGISRFGLQKMMRRLGIKPP